MRVFTWCCVTLSFRNHCLIFIKFLNHVHYSKYVTSFFLLLKPFSFISRLVNLLPRESLQSQNLFLKTFTSCVFNNHLKKCLSTSKFAVERKKERKKKRQWVNKRLRKKKLCFGEAEEWTWADLKEVLTKDMNRGFFRIL